MSKQDEQPIAFPQKLLFHILRKHRELMLEFRIWFVARNILDSKRSGRCEMFQLAKFARIKPETIKKAIRNSTFFRGYKRNDVYYVSLFKIAKKHRLAMKTLFRIEYPSKKILEQFKNNLGFKSYIVKCYFQNDLNKKYPRYTNGRISVCNAAENLGLSKRTIQRLLKKSGAVRIKNMLEFKDITFSEPLGNWLLNNADRRINGYLVGENFHSFSSKKLPNGLNYLRQQQPNIFSLGRACLAIRTIKGQRHGSSSKKR